SRRLRPGRREGDQGQGRHRLRGRAVHAGAARDRIRRRRARHHQGAPQVMDDAALAYFALIGDPTPGFMLDRYDGMLATLASDIRNRAGDDESAPEHLRWMIQQMRTGMEPLQASRWLGWVH